MYLPPAAAAMAMGFSSVSVVVSSLWLKRFRRTEIADKSPDAIRPPSKAARLWNSLRGHGPTYSKLRVHDDDADADLEMSLPNQPRFVIESDDEDMR
jgi:hypothetical protein